MIDANKSNEAELLSLVREARETGAPVKATLKTDAKVFARITDGIYREPASALRELIANAYDADASEVRVETDAPRFSKIVVRDNGHGLTEAALVHVICHIGGSLKREQKGAKYNVVNTNNAELSPGGRRLIGKLGIGLFSVSQLTHHLTIVTKVKGEDVRRVCDILLVPQSDLTRERADDEEFVTGNALLKTVPASDIDSQGTEITLHEIRPFVRESLQSSGTWASIEKEPSLSIEDQVSPFKNISEISKEEDQDDFSEEDEDFVTRPPIPEFHIGRVSQSDPEVLIVPPKLPWDVNDSADVRFQKLVEGIQRLDTGILTKEKVKLEEVLDSYFRTIWTLSLSVPIPYLKKHPFSLNAADRISTYGISNKTVRPKVEEIRLSEKETLREYAGFVTQNVPSPTAFSVYFDGILLKRPITFPLAGLEDGKSLLFVGRIKSDMKSLPKEYSGGPIEVEAYFYWQNRIVPTDHNGIMVRINGASGIMFDDQFLKYQVSEQTRLRQITAEVFIVKGLDAALNIDRESFNIAHPHYQFLKKWVHNSLRQVVTKHKSLSKGNKDLELTGGLNQAIIALNEIVGENQSTSTQKPSLPPFSTAKTSSNVTLNIKFDREFVLAPRNKPKSTTTVNKLREKLMEEQIVAVDQVLSDYEFYTHLDISSKNQLLRKIVAIFTVDIK